MDKDYLNFIERMGSFDDELDFNDEETIKHYGVLGMHWGQRKSSSSSKNKSKQASMMKFYKALFTKKIKDFDESERQAGKEFITLSMITIGGLVVSKYLQSPKGQNMLYKQFNKNSFNPNYDVLDDLILIPRNKG